MSSSFYLFRFCKIDIFDEVRYMLSLDFVNNIGDDEEDDNKSKGRASGR
ncbi:hypothetical protein kac65v162_gp178 [Nodularia phage vB_NspS-kac65v162]|uniref:Uncharacterized protein n=3 Tax=Ravarandavirus kac65v151 TaxID=2845689 RepID=A0A482MIM8_9CAUD|nr:hypothetical protein HWC12_gp139 [Nodularia phage vB_NspS-kac65v151]QBQ73208.1 hypothetical protein kac65v151_gp178 [Nodularia phage vB_NspS-kac65v151]QBQ73416.1 hypothetical protein kac65v161_gp178 [Nodularia phage vB_NspS-kac65v161]QBQ73622.1 hypothetical protein kac65v162_gp178 [Nodularia phage vB_NspS-kac65v162]